MIPGWKRGNSYLQCGPQKLRENGFYFFLFSVISESLLGTLEIIKEVEKRRPPKEILKQCNFTFFLNLSLVEEIQSYAFVVKMFQASCWKTNIYAPFYANSTISLIWRNGFILFPVKPWIVRSARTRNKRKALVGEPKNLNNFIYWGTHFGLLFVI